ncbi:MAG: hypothetical protein A3J47_04155 [Candidatus Yanofskybacteria bacterium RIFCSPHIGHO2_02_FULL_43_22]|uniref:Ribulose-phosphate 3-epimerase n=1 Tax=Candidatus Yanofskybacteria bacterium RIFCSPHIGHO2_02_FULL_43_22 TaxID=1802681 RepID=A0A1F8FQH4_9BACT|nr:MAG: hypothetical protein A3J47_04155 [Candidatus Yanofskybacteria bacterium RIFCSPHIGHO2_02_FULL_43_22]
MAEIVPAILTNSIDEFDEMMRSAETHFPNVHLDIADGIFVPNMTISGTEELERNRTPLIIIAHLMVANPENILKQWLHTRVDGLIFHIESTKKMDELIDKTKDKGKKVGIAINPDTPTEAVGPFIDKIDFVHFMTVNPGFYGSEFKEEVLNKIKNFSQKYPNIEIAVDGGIDLVTARKVVEAGADVLVVGSYFFKNGKDIGGSLKNMKKEVY